MSPAWLSLASLDFGREPPPPFPVGCVKVECVAPTAALVSAQRAFTWALQRFDCPVWPACFLLSFRNDDMYLGIRIAQLRRAAAVNGAI